MSGYVFVIRSGDLYRIGITNNLKQKFKSLKPDEIVKTIKAENPKLLQARLFRRYKSNRLPDSDFFRLTTKQVSDCLQQMGSNANLPKPLSVEVDISLTASFLLVIFTSICFAYFGKNLLLSLSFSLLIGSIPMWILFLLGNFGGYDISDLPLFSSWLNRLKAFLFAILTTFFAYKLFTFIA
tara:strand:- start:58 stop:603 length:546 start_codon:yes stop_codon:yes gene_type:complete